jgi:cytochrome P450
MSLTEAAFKLVHGARMEAYAAFPGPEPSLPLGNAGDFLGKKPWEVLQGYAEQYGPAMVFWRCGSPVLVISDAEAVRQILVDDVGSYHKAEPISALEPSLGMATPFMAADRAAWAPRIAKTALTTVVRAAGHAWLGAQVEVVREETSAGLRGLASCGPVDVASTLRRLGFDVFAQMLFGRTLDEDDYEHFLTMARASDHRLDEIPYPEWMPSFLHAKDRWLETMRELVVEARRAPDPAAKDLLQTALRSGTPQTDEELAWDLSNVFFGGLFSSSTTVVTVLHELTRHPEVLAALGAELEAGGPGWPAIAGSRRLEQVLRESLRLRPPVPIFMRSVNEAGAVTLAGREVPAGTTIYLSSWIFHHAEEHWADAATWCPARWTDEVLRDNPWGSGYFWPFGRGERTCAGAGMATLVMKVMVATILAESAPVVGEEQEYDGELFHAVMLPKDMKACFPPRIAAA